MEPFLNKTNIYDSSSLALRIHAGAAALIPTDTLPALASSPENSSKLWDLKRRPANKPLILMGSNTEELLEGVFAEALDDAHLIAKKYWPGPLTMVLPTSDQRVDFLNPGAKTLGLRVPACEAAINLLSLTGPLATTSANLSGLPTALDMEKVRQTFPDLPLLGPVPWPIPSGLASTLIVWDGPGNWNIRRRGAVLPENL